MVNKKLRDETAKDIEDQMRESAKWEKEQRTILPKLLEDEEYSRKLFDGVLTEFESEIRQTIQNIREAKTDEAIGFSVQVFFELGHEITTYRHMEALATNQRRMRNDLMGFVEAYMSHNEKKMDAFAQRLLKNEEEVHSITENDKKIVEGLTGLNERLKRIFGEGDHA
jgi:hypothetical protein